MPFASDNWTFPVSGHEAGMDYTDIKPGMRVYDARGIIPANEYPNGVTEKIGYTVHHDAVPFTGMTIAEEVSRIQAIDTYHRNHNGWPGIGYHRIIAPSGRVYLVGSSSTQRAHVANLNHQWIGYCFLGDYTTAGRPSVAAMDAFKGTTQWETTKRGVAMLLAPHKAQTAGTKCPGVWAAVDAWIGVVLTPEAVAPPPPVVVPTPDTRVVHARELIGQAQALLADVIEHP